MGIITFLKQTAASVPTPAASKVSVFVDSVNGEPKYKNDAGEVLPLVGGFSIQRFIANGSVSIASAAAANTYAVEPGGGIASGQLNGSARQGGNFYFDPADYEIPGKKVKFKLTAVCMTPDTASTITHTVGLYPITGSSGELLTLINTVGEVVAGSTVAFASQAAQTIAIKEAKGFEATKGLYALGNLTSGTNTVNCRTAIIAKLQMYWE